MRALLLSGLAITFGLTACEQVDTKFETVAENISDGIENVVIEPPLAEELATGFWWSEGPVWIGGEDGYLLFTDVPQNKMFKWSELGGLEVYLEPSGANLGEDDGFREPGANGLFLLDDEHILLADHGNRALMKFHIANKEKTVLADSYDGKKLNSPNDITRKPNGVIYFTDPPYGLKDIDESPLKEQPHNGVYGLSPDGELFLVDGSMTKPNGIGVMPDGETLVVANSDPKSAKWYIYKADPNEDVVIRDVLHDATENVGEDNPGLPDGMTITNNGLIIATGPGGLYLLNKDGFIKRLDIPRASANVAQGADGHLYVTSGDRLIRYDMDAFLAWAEQE